MKDAIAASEPWPPEEIAAAVEATRQFWSALATDDEAAIRAVASRAYLARFVDAVEPAAAVLRMVIGVTADECRAMKLWPETAVDEPPGALQLLVITGPADDPKLSVADLSDHAPISIQCLVLGYTPGGWNVVDNLRPDDGTARYLAARTKIPIIPAVAKTLPPRRHRWRR